MARLQTILFGLSLCILLSGCITKVSVQTAYPFEKRYSSGTDIRIDGNKLDIPRGKSVWILSNDTLYNLLDNAKGK